MSLWIVLQLIVNLILFAGLVFLFIFRQQNEKEDQKLSKGLQLLQNKISVLEDLSDQTDEQVRSLTQLLEGKYKEIQGLLVESDQQIQRMEEIAKRVWDQLQTSGSFKGSAEVDNMNKYVKAAQMAHQGSSIEDIIREIDMTRGEAELIVAMNRDQLTFNQKSLPAWVEPQKAAPPQPTSIGMEFIKALKKEPTPSQGASPSSPVGSQSKKDSHIRPFEFKRIDLA
jgi:hypothetical protein